MGEAWKRVVKSGVLDMPSPRCADPASAGLVEGVRRFNAGEFYECHEVLEEIWHAEREPVRYLYQGILQIGVGFHHWRNENYRGASLLLRDGIEKVRRFTPICMGVDTERLCHEAQACLDQLLALGRERMGEFDWSLVPTIRLVHDAESATN